MSPSSSPEEETPSSPEVEEHPVSRSILPTAATAEFISRQRFSKVSGLGTANPLIVQRTPSGRHRCPNSSTPHKIQLIIHQGASHRALPVQGQPGPSDHHPDVPTMGGGSNYLRQGGCCCRPPHNNNLCCVDFRFFGGELD